MAVDPLQSLDSEVAPGMAMDPLPSSLWPGGPLRLLDCAPTLAESGACWRRTGAIAAECRDALDGQCVSGPEPADWGLFACCSHRECKRGIVRQAIEYLAWRSVESEASE